MLINCIDYFIASNKIVNNVGIVACFGLSIAL